MFIIERIRAWNWPRTRISSYFDTYKSSSKRTVTNMAGSSSVTPWIQGKQERHWSRMPTARLPTDVLVTQWTVLNISAEGVPVWGPSCTGLNMSRGAGHGCILYALIRGPVSRSSSESFIAVAASKSTLVFIYRHWSDLFVYKFLEGNPDQWL